MWGSPQGEDARFEPLSRVLASVSQATPHPTPGAWALTVAVCSVTCSYTAFH